jgi:1-acyl-sn-glycerol-3-phosphate acyltransferase
MSSDGEIGPFQPGIGMIASKLGIPVVPIRIDGMHRVLHPSWKMARMSRVRITFGEPLNLTGSDYLRQAKLVEAAITKL